VLLGLGPAGVYALAGQGVVTIYRGSGVLNFGYGAQALFAAEIFVSLYQNHHWPLALAITIVLVISAVIGLVISQVVMRPLRTRSPVVKVIATLGILALLEQVVELIFGTTLQVVYDFLPTGTLNITHSAGVGYDRLTILAVACLVAVSLTLVSRRTRFGLLTAAAAENAFAVRTLGRSPEVVSAITWTLGSALAGLAGILIVPISGLDYAGLTLLVVPALAGAMLGGFSSFAGVVAGSLVVGIGTSLLTDYIPTPGGGQAFPFLIIILVTAVRGSVIPTRDEIQALLPRVGRNRPGVGLLTLVFTVAVAAAFLPSDVSADLTTTVLYAIVALSLVVLTGLAGQISLAQFAIAGMGGFVAARLSDNLNWPFLLVAVIGVAAAVLVALVFALPAFRTRGPTLAVATLGLALVVEDMVFTNQSVIGGFSGTPVHPPSVFGLRLDPTLAPQRYSVLCVVVFGLLAFMVACARSGRIGRRLLAVRSNERAAAAVGISTAQAKFYAFGFAGFIAAAGGVLMAFQYTTVIYSEYSYTQSLNLVAYATIGGVGFIAGSAVAGTMVPAGLFQFLIIKVKNLSTILIGLAGPLVIAILIGYPDGVAATYRKPAAFLRSLPVPLPRLKAQTTPPDAPPPPAAALVVSNLSIHFGGIRAVDEFSMTVHPGTVHGLIGPNGAGKTTLIDAISGFVPIHSGEIMVGNHRVTALKAHERSRCGIGRSFQSVELFDDMTVLENILVACEPMPWTAWVRDLLPSRHATIPRRVAAIVSDLGLGSLMELYPTAISYGDRKMVGIARALASNPAVLLLDEPASGLSEDEAQSLGRHLQVIATQRGVSVLLVEHDVSLVAAVSNEVSVIHFGRRIASGSPAAVLTQPEVVSSYLGDSLSDGGADEDLITPAPAPASGQGRE
jgi:ABC-type branched-subunit amino acid transport system ATPase component/branched-subunit amino acid ABC-type transport system permease component